MSDNLEIQSNRQENGELIRQVEAEKSPDQIKAETLVEIENKSNEVIAEGEQILHEVKDISPEEKTELTSIKSEIINLQTTTQEEMASLPDDEADSHESLANFDFRIKPQESNEEFLARLNNFVEEDREQKEAASEANREGSETQIRLKTKQRFNLKDPKRYAETYQEYGEYHRQAFSLLLESSNKETFNKENNEAVLEKASELLATSARDYDYADDFKSLKYFSKTDQNRKFFAGPHKSDHIPYAASLFEVWVNSPEAIKYLKQQLDNKKIGLLGGGESIQDLLDSNDIKPEKVVNIDPYLISEDIDRNTAENYQSLPFKADDPNLRDKLAEEKIDKFDEIWASYSVPFYSQAPEEIDTLFDNATKMLNQEGNLRITPLNLQNEKCKQAMLKKLSALAESGQFNFHLTGEALIIHKL